MTKRTPNCTLLLTTALLIFAGKISAQDPVLAWDATQSFKYNVEKISVTTVTATSWSVKVIISVSNPAPSTNFPDPYWNIKTATPFVGGTLRVLVGWSPTEYTNTNSRGNLNPVPTGPSNVGAALPVSINALTAAIECTASSCPELGGSSPTGKYYVTTTIAPMAFPASATVSSATAAIEGHPICPQTAPLLPGCPTSGGVPVPANIPVKSVVQNLALTGSTPADRRQIVKIENCKKCHDDGTHSGQTIPRLSLHGANRNEELGECVVCHNGNQTDIPYRTSGAEQVIDFKHMVHAIHAGSFRSTPYQVIGFNGVLYDFSTVKFPAELSNCNNCHFDVKLKGTFELPISTNALGSTNNTLSTQANGSTPRTVDVDPNNDLKITPIAAACSACHDNSEAKNHMVKTGGASFSIHQSDIVPGVTEKCNNCHGKGKEEDVRRVHEVKRSR